MLEDTLLTLEDIDISIATGARELLSTRLSSIGAFNVEQPLRRMNPSRGISRETSPLKSLTEKDIWGASELISAHEDLCEEFSKCSGLNNIARMGYRDLFERAVDLSRNYTNALKAVQAQDNIIETSQDRPDLIAAANDELAKLIPILEQEMEKPASMCIELAKEIGEVRLLMVATNIVASMSPRSKLNFTESIAVQEIILSKPSLFKLSGIEHIDLTFDTLSNAQKAYVENSVAICLNLTNLEACVKTRSKFGTDIIFNVLGKLDDKYTNRLADILLKHPFKSNVELANDISEPMFLAIYLMSLILNVSESNEFLNALSERLSRLSGREADPKTLLAGLPHLSEVSYDTFYKFCQGSAKPLFDNAVSFSKFVLAYNEKSDTQRASEVFEDFIFQTSQESDEGNIFLVSRPSNWSSFQNASLFDKVFYLINACVSYINASQIRIIMINLLKELPSVGTPRLIEKYTKEVDKARRKTESSETDIRNQGRRELPVAELALLEISDLGGFAGRFRRLMLDAKAEAGDFTPSWVTANYIKVSKRSLSDEFGRDRVTYLEWCFRYLVTYASSQSTQASVVLAGAGLGLVKGSASLLNSSAFLKKAESAARLIRSPRLSDLKDDLLNMTKYFQYKCRGFDPSTYEYCYQSIDSISFNASRFLNTHNALLSEEEYKLLEYCLRTLLTPEGNGNFDTRNLPGIVFLASLVCPNFEDPTEYACRPIDTSVIQNSLAPYKIYETVAFNPVTLTTGDKMLTKCCMLPANAGHAATQGDFCVDTVSELGVRLFRTYWMLGGVIERTNPDSPDGVKISSGEFILNSVYCSTQEFEARVEDVSEFRRCSQPSVKIVRGASKIYIDLNDFSKSPITEALTKAPDESIKLAVSNYDGCEYTENMRPSFNSKVLFEAISAFHSVPEIMSRVFIGTYNDYNEAKLLDYTMGSSKSATMSGVRISYTDAYQHMYEDIDGYGGAGLIYKSAFGNFVVSSANAFFTELEVFLKSDGSARFVYDSNKEVDLTPEELRYAFSYPCAQGFIPFKGTVSFFAEDFEDSDGLKAYVKELLYPSWFESLKANPLKHGGAPKEYATVIFERTPQVLKIGGVEITSAGKKALSSRSNPRRRY